MSCTKHAPQHRRALKWVPIKRGKGRLTVCVCVDIREATWPRQHVTLPTGVAETKFDEDPEAEEAAVASAQGADSTTPTSKSAPDRNSSGAHDALEGMCSVSHPRGRNPPAFSVLSPLLIMLLPVSTQRWCYFPHILINKIGRGMSWLTLVERICTVCWVQVHSVLNNLQTVCNSPAECLRSCHTSVVRVAKARQTLKFLRCDCACR